MPSLSIYLNDDLYEKLRATKESPSAIVKSLLEEYLAKMETPARFQIAGVVFLDKIVTYVLLDKSKPENKQGVMMSTDKKELEAYIEKAEAMRKGK